MKLSFLKIDQIFGDLTDRVVEIPTGGVRFEFRDKEIANAEPLQLELQDGEFVNTVREIDCEVFDGQALTGAIMCWSVYSIVANESFERAIKERLGIKSMPESALITMEKRLLEVV